MTTQILPFIRRKDFERSQEAALIQQNADLKQREQELLNEIELQKQRREWRLRKLGRKGLE